MINTLKVKYDSGAPTMAPLSDGEWIALKAPKKTVLGMGEFQALPLGAEVTVPEGWEALVLLEPKAYTDIQIILPAGAVVYTGTAKWTLPVLAVEDTIIQEGSIVAKFRLFEKMPRMDIEKV